MVVILRFNKRRFLRYKRYIFLGIVITLLMVVHFFEISFHVFKPVVDCGDKIDVVYTWVNGSDPEFFNIMKNYTRRRNQVIDYSKKRFDDKNELKFSLRSLEKFAPWINHVYIVTNGQIPYWLNLDYEKVTLVTHEEIFVNKNNLPSFSSPAIESNLHSSNVYIEDFYSPNRGFLVYLSWPVPMCASSCPWLYVADGQCDEACNNPDCQFDGGDCENSEEVHGVELSTEDELSKKRAMEETYWKIKSNLNLYQNQTVLFYNQYLNSFNGTKDFSKLLRNRTLEQIKSNLTTIITLHNKRILYKDKLLRRRRSKQPKSKNKNSAALHFFDAYLSSLQHTNRLLNTRYGFRTRKVPSHSPLLIDKDIMRRLHEAFNKELTITEKNRIRSKNDLQFSFSYYHFLMSEKVTRSASEIFDKFDTDSSGTWSDREIRTILTRLYELPLSYASVEHFDSMLFNCSGTVTHSEVSTPRYERYIDSKLPTVSKELVMNCPALVNILLESFGRLNRYKYEVIENAEEKYVQFVMLLSNITDVVRNLDGIRRSPRKFVCLNDNLYEYREQENEVVRAVLYDFYISLFPHQSKFELPEGFMNKFSKITDLNLWKKYHFKVRMLVYIVVAALLYFMLFSFLRKSVCRLFNKVFC